MIACCYSPMSDAKYKLLSLFFAFLITYVIGCKNNSMEPIQPNYGMSGSIYDSSGSPVQGAGLYCLYYLPSVPPLHPQQSRNALAAVDTFGFSLYQAFPNPCSDDLFIRFSLPQTCITEMSITSKQTGKPVFQRIESLPYGLFQFSFQSLVDSADLANGVYYFRLTATPQSGVPYRAENTILVVSDKGAANTISASDGSYFFDIRNAFIGDSIATTTDGTSIAFQHLDTSVTFLITKEGFESQIINQLLLPSRLSRRDIVLRRLP